MTTVWIAFGVLFLAGIALIARGIYELSRLPR